MGTKAAWGLGPLLGATLLLVVGMSTVAAARCQISGVSYAYPQQADPNQPIEVDTKVAGSCVTTGVDYYLVRVDLVDSNSTLILSSSSTPIGYSADNFTVTARNYATAPSYNATWPLRMYVYVIRAGGTGGSYLLDYRTIGNATIQVGTIPVPEFQTNIGLTVGTILIVVTMIGSRVGPAASRRTHRKRGRHERQFRA